MKTSVILNRLSATAFFLLITMLACGALVVSLAASDAYAQNKSISQEMEDLLGSLQTVAPKGMTQTGAPGEPPRVSFSKDGYVRHLGAPPSHYFPVSSVVPGKPAETARNFLKEHEQLFGVRSAAVDFRSIRSRTKNNHNYERFEQTYREIPVFGAQVIVQLNELGGIEYVLSDIARDTQVLDSGALSIDPIISAREAGKTARGIFEAKNPDAEIRSTEPRLMLFDPSVLGSAGRMRLVWHFSRVYCEENPFIDEEVLLDAHSGELVRDYPLYKEALDRTILDHHNNRGSSGDVEREEGDSDTGDTEVDHAYHNLGYTYWFYWNKHHRDSIDDAGVDLEASVRYCHPTKYDCPMSNAFGGAPHTYYGEGYAVDDVVGHEYTHGVTKEESNLIYENQSGAINESFSDIWGEFVDQTYNSTWDDDSSGVKWLMGEDLSGGAIRDMADPPAYNDPDRMGSPHWYTGTGDHGGVHTNCGVGNKLCYLLTDGETFNGQTVTGMGIGSNYPSENGVAHLFYEVQTNLLSSSADYYDLCDALVQAAVNLSWSDTKKNNLYRACLAVEITSAGRAVYVDGNYTGTEYGTFSHPYNTVIEGYNAANPGDTLYIKNGPFDETLTFQKILKVYKWGSGADVVIGN